LDLEGRKRDRGENYPDDELHILYFSLNIFRVIKSRSMSWVGHVAHMEEGRGVYRVLIGRPELGRLRHRGKDNIKMNLREIRLEGSNWIRLAQDKVQWFASVNTEINLRVP
jgi:hypothetical protein